jgi:hypothetical protein
MHAGNYPADGSILMPLSGRGNASATPFIQVLSDAALKGVVIWHVEQASPIPW